MHISTTNQPFNFARHFLSLFSCIPTISTFNSTICNAMQNNTSILSIIHNSHKNVTTHVNSRCVRLTPVYSTQPMMTSFQLIHLFD